MAKTAAPIVVIGAGGHARVLAEAIAASGLPLAGHLSPEADRSGILGLYLGDDSVLGALVAQGHQFAIGLGFVDAVGAARRADLLARLAAVGAVLARVVHPAAMVSPSARLEDGCFLAAGAIVGTQVHIGRGGIVNSGAVVDHDAVIGENCHIATGARLAGGITMGRDVLIGAGAVLLQGLTVGAGAVVGAGSVVIRAVPAGTTVVGNPAQGRRP